MPLRVRSLVGLLPLCATVTLDSATFGQLPYFAEHFDWFCTHKSAQADVVVHPHALGHEVAHLLSVVDPDRLRRRAHLHARRGGVPVTPRLAGALTSATRTTRFSIELAGMLDSVDYEPGESTTDLFGGNSNWRGPVWFPSTTCIVEALRRFHRFLGDGFTVECPTGSGKTMTLEAAADEISRRLVSIFLDGPDGRRPVFGGYEKFQRDPGFTASSRSTSISTATPGKASAPLTRRAGQVSWPT